MARDTVAEWSDVPADNVTVGPVNIGDYPGPNGMIPPDVNNAMREMMSQIKRAVGPAAALDIADEPAAIAGLDNTEVMGPLGTRQAINQWVPELAAPYLRQPEKFAFAGAAPSPVGLVDSLAAINASVSAAAVSGSGERLVRIRGAGFLGVSSKIIPKTGVKIVVDKGIQFIPLSSAVTLIGNNDPDATSFTALTSDGLKYTDRVTVGAGNTGAYSIGGYAQIRSQTLLPSPVNSQGDKCGQLAKVVYIDTVAGVLHLDRSLMYDYLVSAAAEVAPQSVTSDFELEGFRWGLRDDSIPIGARMFDLANVANFTIADFEVANNRAQGGALNSGRGCVNLRNALDGRIHTAPMTHVGWYGIAAGPGVHNLSVKDVTGHYMRHVFSGVYSGNGGGYGEWADVTLENVWGHYCDYAAIDTHDTGRNLAVWNSGGIGGQLDTGIQIRSRDTLIDNCETHGNRFDGVGVEAGADNCVIRNHKARFNRRSAINSDNRSTLIEGLIGLDNGEAATSGSAGIKTKGGVISDARLERNYRTAIDYGAASDGLKGGPLLLQRMFSQRISTTVQNRVVLVSSVNDLTDISMIDCELRDHTAAPFERVGGSVSGAPEIRRRRTQWGTTATPRPARSGRVTLAAGVATVTSGAVRLVAAGANIPPVLPNVGREFETPSTTEERLFVSAWTDGSFTLKSSDAASTRAVLWEILD